MLLKLLKVVGLVVKGNLLMSLNDYFLIILVLDAISVSSGTAALNIALLALRNRFRR